MADDNWPKVREIFDSAVRRKPEERQEFVIAACGGDKTLLAEVESLLSSLDSAESFMEAPAVAGVADALAGNGNKLENGQSLGHYRIIKEIGSGGMGEVYLAKDQKLDRHVAIKILNEKFSGDESSLTRFIREAKAASALNHPNILVIHEIDEADGAHFIVSEYVEGETLRTVFQDKPLKLSEVLDISIQIAGALTAAHKAHLIHRDIKPENIMIRPDGYVKILDFGLAKLIEQKNRSFLGLEESTAIQNQTAKGLILGTVNYMSPEQAKGEDVDERTDIFSLGVVIYEMIAGRTPFVGDSMSETFANLINAQPPPLSRFAENVPDELQRIVAKMLRKNKDERFQTMKGLFTDMKELQDNLTLNEHSTDSYRANPQKATATFKATTDDTPVATTVFQIGSTLRWITPLVIITGLAIAGIVGVKLWNAKSQGSSPAVAQRRLTVEGGATRVAMSEDGRYSAVAQNAALILFDLQNGGQRTLVPAEKDIRIMTIAFRPDTEAIYFGTRQISSTFVTIYSIPLRGGETTKILDNIYGPLSFSPDSRKFAFIRLYPELNEYALLTANSDGSNITKLASSRMPNRFEGSPAWSPDGNKIVCSAISVEGGFHFTIAKVDALTGSVEFVPDQRWTGLNSLSWLADSQRLVVSGQDEKSVNAQLWQIDSNTGAASRLIDDLFVYESISATSDGRSIVAVKIRHTSHLWMLGEQQVHLTAGFDNRDGVRGLAWSGDGSILYHSNASGRDAIWRMQIDGSKTTEITADSAGGFAVSPDGKLLVFQGKQSGDHLGLQLMNLVDGSEHPLTQGVTAFKPSFFPDGKRIAFSSYDKKLSLFEISTGGEQSKLLSEEFVGANAPIVSPSGKFIACPFSRSQSGNAQSGIAIIDTKSKQVVSSYPAKVTIGSLYEEPTIQWSNDESEVYFIQLVNTVSNIKKIKLSDGTVSNVTNFADGRIFNFAMEPGGKRMLIARGFVERDASLITIDRPL